MVDKDDVDKDEDKNLIIVNLMTLILQLSSFLLLALSNIRVVDVFLVFEFRTFVAW